MPLEWDAMCWLFLRAGAYGSELKESPKYKKYVFIQRNMDE